MSPTPALGLSAILPAATASTLRAQSLAEAAQKEAARRKEVKGVVRVITNKDLPNVPPATAAPADQTAVPTAPAGGGDVAASGTTATKDDPSAKDDAKEQR